MKVEKTKLDGVLIITPDVFKDHRGEYVEIYHDDNYAGRLKVGGIPRFVQDDVSISHCNVLRGIHGDYKTWKLVSCLYGIICLVVVNNVGTSHSQYHEYTQFILSEQNHQQVLIPPGFGNGHYIMSNKAIFHYKQSTYYDPESQFTLAWNDPELNIHWLHPFKCSDTQPIMSDRDRG